jgi:trehalose 6-phosphate phosphatase
MTRHTRVVTSALLLEALAPLRSHPASTAVLLDIDGTLAPIVENAVDARVPETTRQLLIAIARRYRLVACVSGRQAPDSRAMVSIGTITYLGSHGAELLQPGWTESQLDPTVKGWSERVRQFAGDLNSVELRRSGVRLEDKGPIVALHWRGAADEQLARAKIDEIGALAADAGLATHRGRKVMEIRPPVRIDKGAGIALLLERTGGIENAVYVGDDVTDLDAFAALTRLAEAGTLSVALRVGVRSDDGPAEIEAEADLTVDGTTGVQELLAALAAE